MLTHEKETMLNKVLQLENWFDGYLETPINITTEAEKNKIKLAIQVFRNLNSIKSLINKS